MTTQIGGYQKVNAQIIADSIENLGRKFDLWAKQETSYKSRP